MDNEQKLKYLRKCTAVYWFFCKLAFEFIYKFHGKIYGYPKSFRSLKNYKIP